MISRRLLLTQPDCHTAISGCSPFVLVLVVVVAAVFLFIGFGANAFDKRFRLYSIGTIVLLLVLGIWTSTDGPRIAANLPTPWIGVSERILIFSSLMWTVVFAVLLLRAQTGRLGLVE